MEAKAIILANPNNYKFLKGLMHWDYICVCVPVAVAQTGMGGSP